VRRGDFQDLVQRYLDIELHPRGFRLAPQPPADWDDEKPQVVYEANPDEFGERYPALDIRARGNVPCVDLWVHLDPTTRRIWSELEGTSIESLVERFGVADHAEPAPKSTDTEAQLKSLARNIRNLFDAARRT
jgi:hypothetical protein